MNDQRRMHAALVQHQDSVAPVYRAKNRADRLASIRGLLEDFNRDTNAFLTRPDSVSSASDQLAAVSAAVMLTLNTLLVELEELTS